MTARSCLRRNSAAYCAARPIEWRMMLRSSRSPRGHPAPSWRFRHEPEAAPARPIIGGVRTDPPPGPSSLRSRRCLAPAPSRSAKASPPTGRDMGMATLYGTNGGDVLQGTETWDEIWGFGDNDTIFGYGGGDNLVGGAGNDYVDGGEDADSVYGGDGDDTLKGGGGADYLDGGNNDDLLIGGNGADTLNGGSGEDTASYFDSGTGVLVALTDRGQGGTAQGDTFFSIENLTGSSYNDTLIGDGGRNVLNGGGGYDTLWGDGSTDVLLGGDGDDWLSGGEGDDILNGGAGFDTAYYGDSGAGVFIDLAVSFARGGTAQGDTLTGIEDLWGSAWDDTLTGDGGDNVLRGENGADTLNGGDGRDYLIGGAGGDILNGGAGIDMADYSFSDAGVTVNLGTGQAFGGTAQGDTLTGIENVAGSTFSDHLVGDGGANQLFAGGDNDWLNGGGGIDLLEGGDDGDALMGESGDDILKGGGGADTLVGGAGVDFASYRDSAAAVSINLETGHAAGGTAQGDILTGIENLAGSAFGDVLSGDGGDNVLYGEGDQDWLEGNGGTDTLFGGQGNDILKGGGGADTMLGGIGDDLYVVDSSADMVTEAVGEGTLDRVLTGVTYVLAAGSEVEILETTDPAATTALDLVGNEFANAIVGNAGSNTIVGGRGLDTMVGNDDADQADIIGSDFDPLLGDLIGLNLIDADETLAGDQAFTFIGTAAFTAPGQINWFTNGSDTYILLNTDADLDHEAAIRVLGVHSVDASWFVL